MPTFVLTDSEFDVLVSQTFGPLVARACLSLRLLRAGMHQVDGSAMKIRIRRGTGHVRDFLITLSPSHELETGLDDLRGEIGLGVFAEFRGQRLPRRSLGSLEEWRTALQESAVATDSLLIPNLLGKRRDYPDVLSFIASKRAGRPPAGYLRPRGDS